MVITNINLNYEISGFAASNDQYLINLQNNLKKFYSNSSNQTLLKQFESGQSCIYESIINENAFYRGHIVEINLLNEDLVHVEAVDYGFIECVNKSRLYKVADTYYNKQAIALKFSCDKNFLNILKAIKFESLMNTLVGKTVLAELLEINNKTKNEIKYLIKDLSDENLKDILETHLKKNLSISHNNLKEFFLPNNYELDYYRIEIVSMETYKTVSLNT